MYPPDGRFLHVRHSSPVWNKDDPILLRQRLRSPSLSSLLSLEQTGKVFSNKATTAKETSRANSPNLLDFCDDTIAKYSEHHVVPVKKDTRVFFFCELKSVGLLFEPKLALWEAQPTAQHRTAPTACTLACRRSTPCSSSRYSTSSSSSSKGSVSVST